MKMVEAIIQPDRLEAVKAELKSAGISKMTVYQVRGCGQQMGYVESYRGQTHKINLLPKICIRIALNDDFVDGAIEAIQRSAQSGNIGDGKIFVQPLERCIRIRTGEKGNDAVG